MNRSRPPCTNGDFQNYEFVILENYCPVQACQFHPTFTEITKTVRYDLHFQGGTRSVICWEIALDFSQQPISMDVNPSQNVGFSGGWLCIVSVIRLHKNNLHWIDALFDLDMFTASFIICIMGMISASLGITVWILNIYFHSDDKPVPRWIKRLFLECCSALPKVWAVTTRRVFFWVQNNDADTIIRSVASFLLKGGDSSRIIQADGVSNHQRLDCILNRLFGHRSKKTSKLHVTGLCKGKFPVQRASNAENDSI